MRAANTLDVCKEKKPCIVEVDRRRVLVPFSVYETELESNGVGGACDVHLGRILGNIVHDLEIFT